MSDDQQVRVIGIDGDMGARATSDRGLVSVVKAHFVDEELLAGSNVVQPEEQDRVFTSAGAIQPPYDPEMLCLLYEHSNSLRQNIDAYATNIDGFGHRFEPVFNMKSDDIDDRLATAMFIDRERKAKDPAVDDPTRQVTMPTAEEIDAVKREIVEQMRYEKAILDNFFDFACPDISFVSLRRRTREELEVTGNAYWEIIRNAGGEVAQFNYVAGFTVRLLPLEKKPFEVDVKVKVSDLSYATHRQSRRFRLFVQVVDFQAVIFKEYGDPRIYSKKTGQPFESVAALKANDETDEPATELLHFKIHNPRTPYGIPRWIGNLLAVLGSRQAEEVNFLYFENKSVPPLAVLVSGGKLSSETVPRLQDYIKNHLKGKANFHKILVIEAESQGAGGNGGETGRVKIDIKPLTAAQHNDALFQQYDERNMDKVGQSFRLPRMLRGDIRDFNRSTGDSALAFAEMQVFQPERAEFDFLINRRVIAEMGIRFWRFTSNAPVTRDPATMAEIIRNLVNANVLTPEEGRELASDVFNREFHRLGAAWTKQPVQVTLAGIPVEGGKTSPTASPSPKVEAEKAAILKTVAPEVRRLVRLRDSLARIADAEHEEELRAQQRAENERGAAE